MVPMVDYQRMTHVGSKDSRIHFLANTSSSQKVSGRVVASFTRAANAKAPRMCVGSRLLHWTQVVLLTVAELILIVKFSDPPEWK